YSSIGSIVTPCDTSSDSVPRRRAGGLAPVGGLAHDAGHLVDVVCTLYNHFVVNMPNHLVPSLLQADDGLTEDVPGHRLGDVFCYPASVCVDPDVVLARVQEGHPALTTVLRRHPLLAEPMIGDRPPGRQVQ